MTEDQPLRPLVGITEIWNEKKIRAIWSDECSAADNELALNAKKLALKGTGNPYLLVHLLALIGRAQVMQAHFEQAYDSLNEADYILIEAASRDQNETPMRHRCWLRYLCERGYLFSVSGWESSAQNCFNDGLQMATDLGYADYAAEFQAHLTR
jgi:hypothetical protein